MIYRVLVAVQTIALAAIALAKISSRAPHVSRAAAPISLTLTIGIVVSLAAGVFAYYHRDAPFGEREAILVAWTCFHVAGLLSLTGYAISGSTIYFVAAVVTLALMHLLSPNRFRSNRQPEV